MLVMVSVDTVRMKARKRSTETVQGNLRDRFQSICTWMTCTRTSLGLGSLKTPFHQDGEQDSFAGDEHGLWVSDRAEVRL